MFLCIHVLMNVLYACMCVCVFVYAKLGLYGERIGALNIVCTDKEQAVKVVSQVYTYVYVQCVYIYVYTICIYLLPLILYARIRSRL